MSLSMWQVWCFYQKSHNSVIFLHQSAGLVNLAHYFPYDVKLRLLAHSRIFLVNQKARNVIVGAENLLKLSSELKSSSAIKVLNS